MAESTSSGWQEQQRHHQTDDPTEGGETSDVPVNNVQTKEAGRAAIKSDFVPPLSLSPRWTFAQDIVIDSPPKEQPDEYLGKLNFGLAYDKDSNTLAIHVIQGADLPAMDISGEWE